MTIVVFIVSKIFVVFPLSFLCPLLFPKTAVPTQTSTCEELFVRQPPELKEFSVCFIPLKI